MSTERPEDIVGHKTFATGNPESPFRHEPLTRAEADKILADADRAREKRAKLMPDDKSAIHAMMEAFTRLKELGWREAEYCPKDGTPFQVIEAGSVGIHNCVYQGKWPSGSYSILDDGDIWPARPILFRIQQHEWFETQWGFTACRLCGKIRNDKNIAKSCRGRVRPREAPTTTDDRTTSQPQREGR